MGEHEYEKCAQDVDEEKIETGHTDLCQDEGACLSEGIIQEGFEKLTGGCQQSEGPNEQEMNPLERQVLQAEREMLDTDLAKRLCRRHEQTHRDVNPFQRS